MPALQVRDFPDALYEDLRLCATSEHRSIAQQTIAAVEEMVQRRTRNVGNNHAACIVPFESIAERQARITKRKALFADIADQAHRIPSDIPSPVDMLREAREQRDEQLLGVFLQERQAESEA